MVIIGLLLESPQNKSKSANNNDNYEILQVLNAQLKEKPATISISITNYGNTKWMCVYFLFVFHVPTSFREKEINDAKII